ncbi:hypothetical protein [Lysobacter sp. CA199]|uniref:hypothetical protein n=1 Tax=Lysobacter sp. CA199 TaxID=3455608 RepID=UPI003F8D7291
MPDRNPLPPQNWADAFARLPQETPPTDGWARMAATLAAGREQAPRAADAPLGSAQTGPARGESRHIQTTPRRRAATHPARRWAIAAMLAAALPLGLWLALNAQRPTLPTRSPNPLATVPAARDTVDPQAATPHRPAGDASSTDATASVAKAPAAASTGAAETRANDSARARSDTAKTGLATMTPTGAGDAARESPRRAAATGTAAVATAAVANPLARTPAADVSTAARIAGVSAADAAPRVADASGREPADRIARQLQDLQAESAQLEALVALTRDDSVANASATVMSADLDQRLRLIDAGLTDAALSAEQRLALWHQRVGALRSLAGVESTQRWFAARGERYGDALVRVD